MSRFLICSFALVLLYPAGIDMYLVGLPRIAADLNASEAQLHIAFSVYLAGMAAAMLFAGKVADRSGRKPVAIPGAALFIIASVFCSLAETSTLFLAGRFLQGLGAGCCYVVAFAILRDTLDDRRRAKVLSLLNGITCIIPVLAPVLGHLIGKLLASFDCKHCGNNDRPDGGAQPGTADPVNKAVREDQIQQRRWQEG